VGYVALSPDSAQLASSSADQTIRLWDTTGIVLATLVGHTSWVAYITFSPDGTQLASGADDRTVRIWDTATGAPLAKFEGFTSWVKHIAFSPNGEQLVASDESSVRLWDAVTGAPLATLEGYTSRLEFSADGSQLTTAFGIFDILEREEPLAPAAPTLQSASLGLRKEWVQYRGEDILWLPHDFRGTCSAVYGSTLVVGQDSGAVSFFQIREEAAEVMRSQGGSHQIS
jgi:WD40 repeat protein